MRLMHNCSTVILAVFLGFWFTVSAPSGEEHVLDALRIIRMSKAKVTITARNPFGAVSTTEKIQFMIRYDDGGKTSDLEIDKDSYGKVRDLLK